MRKLVVPIACVAGLVYAAWIMYLGFRALVAGIEEGGFDGIWKAVLAVPATALWGIWVPAKVIDIVISEASFGSAGRRRDIDISITISVDHMDGDDVAD